MQNASPIHQSSQGRQAEVQHSFLVHTLFTTTRHCDPIKGRLRGVKIKKRPIPNPPLWTCIGFAAPTTGVLNTNQSKSRVAIRLAWELSSLSPTKEMRATVDEMEVTTAAAAAAAAVRPAAPALHQAIRGKRKGRQDSEVSHSFFSSVIPAMCPLGEKQIMDHG